MNQAKTFRWENRRNAWRNVHACMGDALCTRTDLYPRWFVSTHQWKNDRRSLSFFTGLVRAHRGIPLNPLGPHNGDLGGESQKVSNFVHMTSINPEIPEFRDFWAILGLLIRPPQNPQIARIAQFNPHGTNTRHYNTRLLQVQWVRSSQWPQLFRCVLASL